jgi:hypothetical protein
LLLSIVYSLKSHFVPQTLVACVSFLLRGWTENPEIPTMNSVYVIYINIFLNTLIPICDCYSTLKLKRSTFQFKVGLKNYVFVS